MQFPFQDVISTMDEVPSEHHFFTPQTNAVLVGFIHRYHKHIKFLDGKIVEMAKTLD
jgi:hypothetical protein